MNVQAERIEAVRAKLLGTQSDAICRVLTDVQSLQRDLVALGTASDAKGAVRMPYSSMPNLSSGCWK